MNELGTAVPWRPWRDGAFVAKTGAFLAVAVLFLVMDFEAAWGRVFCFGMTAWLYWVVWRRSRIAWPSKIESEVRSRERIRAAGLRERMPGWAASVVASALLVVAGAVALAGLSLVVDATDARLPWPSHSLEEKAFYAFASGAGWAVFFIALDRLKPRIQFAKEDPKT